MTQKTFEPIRIGDIDLENRLVMAPMTRNRATQSGEATHMMADYYSQRASAGLIISEAIQPSQVGQGFMNTPGLYTDAQVRSWKHVTDAVHKAGGKIVAQILHAGRIGHPSLYPSAHTSLAPSAIAASGSTFTTDGMVEYPTPIAMKKNDINETISDFIQAAQNAINAGFDGVEIHAGNGFLLHQFMAENTNQRTDEYGGDLSARVRFPIEVAQAVVDQIGSSKTGLRISPANPYNDIVEGDTEALYNTLIAGLPDMAFISIMEANNRPQTQLIRNQWKNAIILNPHEDEQHWPASPQLVEPILQQSLAEAVCLGSSFLANPDLVDRIRGNTALNQADENTFYGGDERGYTDYPTMENKV